MSTLTETVESLEARAKAALEGRRIIEVRFLGPFEMGDLGWWSRPLALVMDNGVVVFAAQDEEGNEAGALFTTDPALPIVPAVPGVFHDGVGP